MIHLSPDSATSSMKSWTVASHLSNASLYVDEMANVLPRSASMIQRRDSPISSAASPVVSPRSCLSAFRSDVVLTFTFLLLCYWRGQRESRSTRNRRVRVFFEGRGEHPNRLYQPHKSVSQSREESLSLLGPVDQYRVMC